MKCSPHVVKVRNKQREREREVESSIKDKLCLTKMTASPLECQSSGVKQLDQSEDRQIAEQSIQKT